MSYKIISAGIFFLFPSRFYPGHRFRSIPTRLRLPLSPLFLPPVLFFIFFSFSLQYAHSLRLPLLVTDTHHRQPSPPAQRRESVPLQFSATRTFNCISLTAA